MKTVSIQEFSFAFHIAREFDNAEIQVYRTTQPHGCIWSWLSEYDSPNDLIDELQGYGPDLYDIEIACSSPSYEWRALVDLRAPLLQHPSNENLPSRLASLITQYRSSEDVNLAVYRVTPENINGHCAKGFLVRYSCACFGTEEDLLECIEREYGGGTFDIRFSGPNEKGQPIYIATCRTTIDAPPRLKQSAESLNPTGPASIGPLRMPQFGMLNDLLGKLPPADIYCSTSVLMLPLEPTGISLAAMQINFSAQQRDESLIADRRDAITHAALEYSERAPDDRFKEQIKAMLESRKV